MVSYSALGYVTTCVGAAPGASCTAKRAFVPPTSPIRRGKLGGLALATVMDRGSSLERWRRTAANPAFATKVVNVVYLRFQSNTLAPPGEHLRGRPSRRHDPASRIVVCIHIYELLTPAFSAPRRS